MPCGFEPRSWLATCHVVLPFITPLIHTFSWVVDDILGYISCNFAFGNEFAISIARYEFMIKNYL